MDKKVLLKELLNQEPDKFLTEEKNINDLLNNLEIKDISIIHKETIKKLSDECYFTTIIAKNNNSNIKLQKITICWKLHIPFWMKFLN